MVSLDRIVSGPKVARARSSNLVTCQSQQRRAEPFSKAGENGRNFRVVCEEAKLPTFQRALFFVPFLSNFQKMGNLPQKRPQKTFRR